MKNKEKKPMKWTRKLSLSFSIICGAALLVFFSYLVWVSPKPFLESEQPALKAQGLFEDPSKVTKHVRVNGTDYDIPVSYFNVMVPPWKENMIIYLIFMWPDFTPLKKSEQQLADEGRLGEKLTSLSDDPRFIKTLDEMAEDKKRNNNRNEITDHQYGLDVYYSEETRGSGHHIPYIREKNGKVITLITCSEDFVKGYGRTKAPRCRHQFYDGCLMHAVNYAKTYLPHWQKIENSIQQMFDEFRARALEKKLDKVVIKPNEVRPELKTKKLLREK